jgi:hypothetical protein
LLGVLLLRMMMMMMIDLRTIDAFPCALIRKRPYGKPSYDIILISRSFSMSDLLIQAAQSAAQADGLAAPPIAASSMSMADPFVGASTTSAAAPPTTTSSSSPGAGAAALHHAKQQQQAQQQAQQAPPPPNSKKGPALRRGKWTPEEEAYANRLIQEFKAGLLPLTDGTTLRTFLSKLLNCDPMRISKKFVGSNCIGKQVFRRRNADMNRLTPEQIQQSRAELSEYVLHM